MPAPVPATTASAVMSTVRHVFPYGPQKSGRIRTHMAEDQGFIWLMACTCTPGSGFFAACADPYASVNRIFGPALGAQLREELAGLSLMSPAEKRTELPAMVARLAPLAAEMGDRVRPYLETMTAQQVESVSGLATDLASHVRAGTVLPPELVEQCSRRTVFSPRPALQAAAAQLDMMNADGTLVHADAVFFCDGCKTFFVQGNQWHGCPHNTRCKRCHSSSTTRGAAEGSAAAGASGTSSASSASSSFQSKA